MVAYSAQADLGVFPALGWPMPSLVIDLYAESRCFTNSEDDPTGKGGLARHCKLFGIQLPADFETKKDAMRSLILSKDQYSPDEMKQIVDYCEQDVRVEADLFETLCRRYGMGSYGESYPIERAIQSGQFAKVIAKIEQNGIPVDMATFRELEQYLPKIKPTLAKIANEEFPVWEEETKSNKWVFKQKKLKEYAESQGITDWATTPSGRLKTETEYLEEDLLVRYPHLEGFVRTYLLMQSVKTSRCRSVVTAEHGPE